MNKLHLSRHAIDRIEHRWTSRLQQDAKAWSGGRGRSRQAQIPPAMKCNARVPAREPSLDVRSHRYAQPLT
jgi:hypothetical protein